jgi:hypothetical protein
MKKPANAGFLRALKFLMDFINAENYNRISAEDFSAGLHNPKNKRLRRR